MLALCDHTQNMDMSPNHTTTDPYLPPSDFQVHDRRVSLFLDGLEEDGTPFDTQVLSTRLSDSSEDGAAMWVGLGSDGK